MSFMCYLNQNLKLPMTTMSTTLNKNLCSSNIQQPMIFAARPNEKAKPMIIDVEANNALMKITKQKKSQKK